MREDRPEPRLNLNNFQKKIHFKDAYSPTIGSLTFTF